MHTVLPPSADAAFTADPVTVLGILDSVTQQILDSLLQGLRITGNGWKIGWNIHVDLEAGAIQFHAARGERGFDHATQIHGASSRVRRPDWIPPYCNVFSTISVKRSTCSCMSEPYRRTCSGVRTKPSA